MSGVGRGTGDWRRRVGTLMWGFVRVRDGYSRKTATHPRLPPLLPVPPDSQGRREGTNGKAVHGAGSPQAAPTVAHKRRDSLSADDDKLRGLDSESGGSPREDVQDLDSIHGPSPYPVP